MPGHPNFQTQALDTLQISTDSASHLPGRSEEPDSEEHFLGRPKLHAGKGLAQDVS